MERKLFISYIILTGFMIFVLFISKSLELISFPEFICLSTVGTFLSFAHFMWVKKCFFSCLNTIFEHIESIRQEDYSRRARLLYRRGIVAKITNSLVKISDKYSTEKEDRHSGALIIFQIIQDIQSPTLIITENKKLYSANHAYKQLYNRPWELDRNIDVSRINLNLVNARWVISEPTLARYWNVEAGTFTDGERLFHMVIFSNIEKSLFHEASESQSQMFRVMNHELRNSLTPIQSLAEALRLQPDTSEKNEKALRTIVNRCDSLMKFIKEYSQLQKEIFVNKTLFSSDALIRHIEQICTGLVLKVSGKNVLIFADQALLEQVIINLMQNAKDAMGGAGLVELAISSDYHYTKIVVRDQGTGIANTDNLFVPFYTTKSTGEGVGLALSKRLILAQDGRITLTNRVDHPGAEATILLPQLTKSSL